MSRMRVYLRLMDYLWRYWPRFTVAVFCTAVVGALNAAPALIVRYAVDDILIARDSSMALLLSLIVVGLYVIKGGFSYLQNYLMYWVGQRVVMDVRNTLNRHFLHLPLRFFDEKTTGELMAKITYDISLMQKASSSALRDLGRHLFTFIGLLAVAFYQNPKAALLFFLVVPPVGYLIVRMGEKIRRNTRRTQERMGDISALMKEIYEGARVVKAFGKEDYEDGLFQKANLSFFRTIMRTMRVRALAPPLVEGIGGLLAGLVLWYSSLMVIRGEVTPGEISSFLVAVGMLYSPLKSLTRVYHTLMEGIAGCQAVFEIMDAYQVEDMNPGGRKMERLVDGIRFEDVSFAYENVPVVQEVSFEVRAGSVFAMVGMSGAGKTTLVDLIPRFYVPDSGRILFDGIDSAAFDLRSLRKQIAVVGQQVILFNDTVANNIAYGAEDEYSGEEIIAAARAANAHEFISALPRGYDSYVGEDGVRLSGGQRQRIAIARAILRNPSILLLDEATSALDTESEQMIQDSLDRLMKGRTTIVVAHRLSTIRNANEIAVVDDGRIVERGTHAELMDKGGLYRKLYELQFAEGEGESPEAPAQKAGDGKYERSRRREPVVSPKGERDP